MSDRDAILARIRERLPAGDREESAAARLREHPAGPLPERARGDDPTLQQRFREQAQAASAEIIDADGPDELPGIITGLLDAESTDQDPTADAQAAAGVVVDESLLAELGAIGSCRRAEPSDALAVSRALCGIAETGTLVLRSGPGRPTTAAFLPPIHVVVLDRTEIVGGYEDAWDRVRAAGDTPRTVNWITGPSRSADIEQTLNMGAHGPIRLVIVLV